MVKKDKPSVNKIKIEAAELVFLKGQEDGWDRRLPKKPVK